MKSRLYILLAIFLCIGFLPSKAQDLSIDVRLDRSEMMIGQQAVIDLTVRTDDLENTLLQLPADSLVKHFEILAYQVTDTIDVDDKIKEIKAQMLITSFDSTLVEIPPFIVLNNERISQSRSLFIKMIMPEVNLEEPEKFNDIKAPWSIAFSFEDILHFFLSHPLTWLILFVTLVLVAWRLYRRYREYRAIKLAQMPAPPEPELTPKQLAMQELQSLSEMWGKKLIESKEYYSKLTEILRIYIDQAAQIPAPKMSSSQLTQTIRDAREKAIRDLHNSLSELLSAADLVKFAKHQPSDREAIDGLRDTLRFIDTADPIWQEGSIANTQGTDMSTETSTNESMREEL